MSKNEFSNTSNEKNVSSLVDLKRKAFLIRLGKVYNRDEFIKNNKSFKRDIARLKTALNK